MKFGTIQGTADALDARGVQSVASDVLRGSATGIAGRAEASAATIAHYLWAVIPSAARAIWGQASATSRAAVEMHAFTFECLHE